MTDPRRQAWAPYIREIADRLRLRDWTIVVRDEEPEDKSADASVYCIYGRKRALIRLSDDFLGDTPEENRHTIVHELLHCHLDDAGYYARNHMPGEAAKEALERFFEKGIDGLADAIAPLMPLPVVNVDSVGRDFSGPVFLRPGEIPPGVRVGRVADDGKSVVIGPGPDGGGGPRDSHPGCLPVDWLGRPDDGEPA